EPPGPLRSPHHCAQERRRLDNHVGAAPTALLVVDSAAIRSWRLPSFAAGTYNHHFDRRQASRFSEDEPMKLTYPLISLFLIASCAVGVASARNASSTAQYGAADAQSFVEKSVHVIDQMKTDPN